LGKLWHTHALLGERMMPPDMEHDGILGRVEINRENNKLGFSVRAVDPSILTHEIFKGLYEYTLLDTSVPSVGEITDDEARIFKKKIESHVVEPLGFVFGPIIAEKVQDALTTYIENNKGHVAHLTNMDNVDAHPALTQLLLFKVVTMLPLEQFKDFYTHVLADTPLDSSFIKTLYTAKQNWQETLP